MEVKSVKKLVGTIYFLIDDNHRPIMPVYRFMLNMISNGYSSNTSKVYAQHLKLYYEWMKLENLDYHSAIGVGTDKKATVHTNLARFKFWLKYPTYYNVVNNKVVEINCLEKGKKIEAKRQASTVNQIMNAVLSFYDFLVLDEGIEKLGLYKESRMYPRFHHELNEMIIKHEKVKKSNIKQKAPKKRIKHITYSQYKLLMENATNPRNRIIIGLLFEGGLRVSELIGLNISDLKDINNGIVHIVKRDDPNNPDAAVKYNSIGDVFVSSSLAKEINDFLIQTMGEIDTNYLIVNLYSPVNRYKPMKRDTIEDMFEQLGKKVGINHLHPHMLRHGLAMDMMKSGVDIEIIKDTLRHQDSSTTANIYARTDTPTRQAAMNKYFKKVETRICPDKKALDELVDFLIEEDMED